MSGFAGITREQLRAQYVDAWRKSRDGLPLLPLEASICEVIAMHGEYHPLLEDAERAQSFEADALQAAQNPFLHMGLHLAIREQLAVNRPAGIREVTQSLRARFGAHAGEHALMQVLGELLWESQRANRAPDEREYLRRARRLLQG